MTTVIKIMHDFCRKMFCVFIPKNANEWNIIYYLLCVLVVIMLKNKIDIGGIDLDVYR